MADPGHQDRFGRCSLARTEHITAAVQMDEEAMAILDRDQLRSYDVDLYAVHRSGLHLYVHPLAQRRQILDRRARAGVGQRFPLGARVRRGVPARIDGGRYQLLHLRTDGCWDGNALRGHLKRRRGGALTQRDWPKKRDDASRQAEAQSAYLHRVTPLRIAVAQLSRKLPGGTIGGRRATPQCPEP